MIKKEIIEFVEKAGFVVENQDDFRKIEIKDKNNSDESLEKLSFSHEFIGVNGRNIMLHPNNAVIGLGNGLSVRQETFQISDQKISNRYETEIMLNRMENFLIRIYCNFANDENFGSISITIKSYSKNTEKRDIYIELKPTNVEVYYDNKLCSSIDVENCNSQIYIQMIYEFLNKNEFVLKYPQIQEGIKIILPFVNKDIETMFNEYLANNLKTLETETVKKK